MPFWFVLLAIGLGLYGLSLLRRDIRKVPPPKYDWHWYERRTLSEHEQERIVFEAIKPGPRSR
jgi:hypothetical protein